MNNLLLPESTFQRVRDRLEPLIDELCVVRVQSDGTMLVGERTVDPEDYPIHLAWMSIDVFLEGYAPRFIEYLDGAPELKWFQTISAGLDNPFFKQVQKRGVRFCNSDAQAPPIAEYVLASVLYRYQNIAQRLEYQQARQWASTAFREIYDSNWLIVGFGNIGERVGRMVRGFEGRVTGVKRTRSEHKDADRIISFDELADALPSADVVVLACALTDDTQGLVDKSFLSAMKPDAILVNIARGKVVDEDALLQALDSDQLDCAILDVFQQEPLPAESRLWSHPKVFTTPHASSRGAGTRDRWDELFLHNLGAYLGNKPLRCEVGASFFD